MKRPTIFLNELSLATDRKLDLQDLRLQVLATLKIARQLGEAKRELIIVGALTEFIFGLDGQTLQSILHGADYRDEWRFIKKLAQANPYDENDWEVSNDLQEIQFEGQAGIGLLRAVTNGSAVLSFPLTETWRVSRVTAQHIRVDESTNEALVDIEILNFSEIAHVAEHQEFLRELGTDISASSIIFEGNDFVLRMYFNDHDPPHFHVMEQHQPSETIARFRIDTLDQLSQSSSLRSGLRRQIVTWAADRKNQLMECWDDCRLHRHPARIE